MEVELDGQVLEMEQVHHIGKGSVIRCGHITEGLRTYIGVKGGFRTPLRLGSRSYFYPVTVDPKLRDGDELAYDPIETFTPKLRKNFWFFPARNLTGYPPPRLKYYSDRTSPFPKGTTAWPANFANR